jgi:bacteriocin biosynthesis cyclodehydratase domain-containing protein
MSRPPARRPTLLPALRRLWRDTHRLQLGTDPGRAVLLELTDPGCARLLDLLDGTRTEAGYLRAAERAGVDTGHATTLLHTLRGAGLVVDAHVLRPASPADRRVASTTRAQLETEAAALLLADPARITSPSPASRVRRRLSARVIVTGASQLVVPIAVTLASAGVGHIDASVSGTAHLTDATPAGLSPADARRPRETAAAEAIRRAAPDVRVGPVRPGQATFVVLVGHSAPAELTALSYGQRSLAHLAVAVRDGTVVVGPLVRPGASPCLNCLDLHRLDRDPGWRIVAAQLTDASDQAEPIAATTALAATAYAAAEVLTHIDGGTPATLGATVEITRPGLTRRRPWTLHPQCGCRRRPRSGP